MKVIKYPKTTDKSKRIMLLGSFYTFHNGHKALLEVAQTYKGKITALLIDDLSLLKKNDKKEFESVDIRLQHMANIGIDEVIYIEFNSKIAGMTGKEFAADLIEKYNVQRFIVGKDFAMGKGASYTAKNLQVDFPTTIVKTQKINDKKVSTTLFREFVEFGDVDLIKKNSPFFYTVDARVKSDNHFKSKSLLPHPGIYASWAIINEVKYWSVVRISSTGNNEIIVPELIVKNSGFDVQIEFAKKIRSVIKKESDSIKEEDHIKTINYLKNNI